MGTTSDQLLLKLFVFIFIILKSQISYALMNDEEAINKIFETHGKENVVGLISQRRDGYITIQKDTSFINNRGRPNIEFVTAKSIIQDLKILKIDISTLKAELDIYVENKSKNLQEENDRLAKSDSMRENNKKRDLSSREIQEKMKALKSKFNMSLPADERMRIQKELVGLRKDYRQSKKNEK